MFKSRKRRLWEMYNTLVSTLPHDKNIDLRLVLLTANQMVEMFDTGWNRCQKLKDEVEREQLTELRKHQAQTVEPGGGPMPPPAQ